MTPSQYQNWLRQQQARQREAIRRHNAEVDRINRANRAAAQKAVDDYNREIDRINQHNRRAAEHNKREVERVNRHNQGVIDDYNRAVRQHNQKQRAAVAQYNQAVRSHNSAVERERQQRIAALRQSATPRYLTVRDSAIDLSDRFERVEREATTSVAVRDLVGLLEREASNSAEVAYALNSDTPQTPQVEEDTGILELLSGFSQDLCDRWQGAIFSLKPENPDAARHFCTSVREIFTEILDRWAPNADVEADDENCDRTPNGTPSRKAKIRYLLRKKGAATPEVLGFVQEDVEEIVSLFKEFNEATHGAAGKHGFAKLLTIRRRVEGGIMFLAAVAL